MIKSFASKETKAFFAGDTVKRYQAFAAAAAGGKSPPGGAHAAGIHRPAQHPHLCFRWQDGDAYDVEIVDYH